MCVNTFLGGFLIFSKRLKNLRIEFGLSQSKLADELGVTYRAIQKYESGEGKPRANNLEKLATIFDVSVSYLLGETNLRESDELNDIVNVLKPQRYKNVISYAKKQLDDQQEESNIIEFNKSLRPYRVVDQALYAGTGFDYTDDVSYSVVYYHEELEYDLATWISGESMEPEFFNGEVVLVKKQEEPDYDGQVCAVDWGGNSYIKKVFIDEEGMVLRSINPLYDDKFASWDEQPRLIGVITYHFKPERKK